MGEVYGAEKPRVSPSILMDYLDNDGEIDVCFLRLTSTTTVDVLTGEFDT